MNDLILQLREKKLLISSWYGEFDLSGDNRSYEWINRGYGYKALDNSVDDNNFPWFLFWEIAWVLLNNEFKGGQSVLDLGGSSSLFSYYLASKGLEVITIDLNHGLVGNANYAAEKLAWNMKNYVMDMRSINFNRQFDHIVSLCVFEHIPMFDRIEINKNIRELLVEGGKFSITFDYRNPSKFSQFDSPTEVHKQFVIPSGLKIRGNEVFYDNQKNYLLHPFFYNGFLSDYKKEQIRLGHFDASLMNDTKNKNDYTFAALFLEKS